MIKTLVIKGMSCQHCVNHVKSALEDLTEVIYADVDLTKETAIIELKENIDNNKLTELIDEEGYELVKIEDK